MYELLTGEVPFPGESFVAVAMRHINEPPPPLRDKRPDVPPRVEAMVQRAMAKSPRDRFASMAELCAEIDACLAELHGGETHVIGSPAVPPQRRRAQRRSSAWPVIVALLALIAAGAVIGYLVLHHPNGNNGSSGAPPIGSGAGTVALSGVTAYDPFGSPPGQEHNSAAPLATDKKPDTYWETEQYHSSFAAIGKPGVGLVLKTAQPVTLKQIGIATATPNFTAVIKAGDSPVGPWTDVSSSQTIQSGTPISLSPHGAHRYWLIWITALPPGQQSVRINEVQAS
jgi:hypothetical protein